MDGGQNRFYGDARVLHQRAVRVPLPDLEAERTFHEDVMTIAEGQKRKADLLADPDVPLSVAYEESLEIAAETTERQLRRIAGDDYEAIARAYCRGERDDRLGELTAYFFEALWRIQQRATVTDMIYSPLIVRYPRSFTINFRFASGYTTPQSIHYESPCHCDEDLDGEHAEIYYEESQYSQRRAAEYLREAASMFPEEFPDPDETSFEERQYGGLVAAEGRRGSVFSAMVARVEPDAGRFSASESPAKPTLVDAGPEAERTERELQLDDGIVH